MDTPELKLGGMGVAELSDSPPTRRGGLPAVVGGVETGQRPAVPVPDAGPEQRPAGVPGPGQVQLEQGDVAAVIQQHSARGAALVVDAHVLVVQPQVQVLHVQAADLGGPGAAHVRGSRTAPSPQPSAGACGKGRRLQITASTFGNIGGRGGPG